MYMALTKEGDKYIRSEYEALAGVLAGSPMERMFHLDMYRFACWALTIDELKPADKMSYIAQITGMEVTRKRVRDFPPMDPDNKLSVISALTKQDIDAGNTFGEETESLTERCLRFMELFAYGICTVGRRKFSQLEKDRIESYVSSQRAEMRRAFERAEQTDTTARAAAEGSAGDTDPAGASGVRRPNPMSRAARDRMIADCLNEPAPAAKPELSPLQKARGQKLLVAGVVGVLAGFFLIALVILLIDESRSNVAVLESYTGTTYTKEQIALLIQEQKEAQRESLLNILWTVLTQIMPGLLGFVTLVRSSRPAPAGARNRQEVLASERRKPGWGTLVAGEALCVAGMIRTIVMLAMGPSWMALAEVPQIFWLVFAARYRRCM